MIDIGEVAIRDGDNCTYIQVVADDDGVTRTHIYHESPSGLSCDKIAARPEAMRKLAALYVTAAERAEATADPRQMALFAVAA